MSLTIEDLRITDALDRKADLRPEFIKGDPYCIAGRAAPRNPYFGSSLEDFLEAEGIPTEPPK